MSVKHGMYYTPMVREFYANYVSLLYHSLWRVAAVPILVGIDNQTVVPTKFYIEMMKDESWLEIQVHKTDTEAETFDMTSFFPQLSPYAFIPTNFVRFVKRVDRQEK
ncbi:hypothetical protein H5410_061876 [Solanum commersonii]|uniref:Uncharacterized protein n=1 Tax=Solanum commersonii TaxID=4109 RepID=A0A9J5WAY5_SOLCO|nr:hypothetical protein H5410_061876 [Solanum commersonii]